MSSIDFPGKQQLVDALDDALEQGSTPAITDAIRNTLCRIIREQSVELPACVFEPAKDHYARRELYQSERYGYGVVAMTWAPGQGTPVHDHAGLWCVEGVWQGALEIAQYQLLERDHNRYRMRPVGTIQAGAGSAGSLIPPHEYHAILNPSEDTVTVSVHIYSAPMTTCCVFNPLHDEWYESDQRQLGLDQMH
ncbi:MAG: cysteine dioxygenase family protein [Xanthomonadales bacterium]|nr:cysteine dioxygenase family protein [Xanthomonadales bacterium]